MIEVLKIYLILHRGKIPALGLHGPYMQREVVEIST